MWLVGFLILGGVVWLLAIFPRSSLANRLAEAAPPPWPAEVFLKLPCRYRLGFSAARAYHFARPGVVRVLADYG